MVSTFPLKLLYSILPCFSYFVLIKSLEFHHKKKDYFLLFLTIFFLIYLYFVLQVTGIDSIYLWKTPSFGNINLTPFDTFAEISDILNIVLFLPLGLFVPIIWNDYQSLKKTLLLGSSCSLVIEIFQLFCNRVTDIDDLFMNSLGCMLGYLIWKLCHRKLILNLMIEEKEQERATVVGKSPIIWILLLLFGYLFLYP